MMNIFPNKDENVLIVYWKCCNLLEYFLEQVYLQLELADHQKVRLPYLDYSEKKEEDFSMLTKKHLCNKAFKIIFKQVVKGKFSLTD